MDEKRIDMFVITYGEVVAQIIKDCNQDVQKIDEQLDAL
jgi:hypothetical protein